VDEQSLSRQWGDLQQAVADTGFSLTEKHLVLTGICAKCR
jgi:putative transcriptional regulator